MKPKEWLLKNGHIKEITRGRMSREHISLIENAVRNGASIEGYGVSTTAPAEKSAPVKVEKVGTDPNRILDIPEFPVRDEREWQGYANVNGKIRDIGMRTVCNTCNNSLSYCGCKSPIVWIDHETTAVVNFKGRVTPLSNRRW